jgi:outer membrane protein OmpA-like peptidoglycan-associated protein
MPNENERSMFGLRTANIFGVLLALLLLQGAARAADETTSAPASQPTDTAGEPDAEPPSASEPATGPAAGEPSAGAETPDGGPSRVEVLQAEAARLRSELADLLQSLAERRQVIEDERPGASAETSPQGLASEMPAGGPAQPVTVIEVFFDSGKSDPTPADRSRLAGAAEALRGLGVSTLRVVGFSDTKGSAQANDAVSLKRARAVARVLAGAGFKEGRLEAMSSREAGLEPPVPTGEGVAEPLNRRVRVLALVEPGTVAEAPRTSLAR